MNWHAWSHALIADVGAFVTLMGGDDGLIWLGGFYFGMIGLEFVGYALFKPGAYNTKEGLNNVVVNLINVGFDAVTGGIAPLALYFWLYAHARTMAPLSLAVSLPLAFVGHEIAYYVDHRIGHRVGLFWAFHQVHHSSNEFNLPVAARGFLIDGNIVLHAVALPLALIGVPPTIWVGMHGAKSIYGIFNHADFVPRLGILEEFIATPANHRAHHGIQPKYIDKNYSQVTVILDRLLGTFQREEERAIVGLPHRFESYNPVTTQLGGLVWLRDRMKSADRWQDRVRYLWMPPEWTHNECDRPASRGASSARV